MDNKRCACEFIEVEACDNMCSCRNKYMSGGCSRCATFGNYEQQVFMAKYLAKKLGENSMKSHMWSSFSISFSLTMLFSLFGGSSYYTWSVFLQSLLVSVGIGIVAAGVTYFLNKKKA